MMLMIMNKRKYFPGDVFELSDGHKTIVSEINNDYWPIKLISLEPDEKLGKIGWFREGENWIVFQYSILGGDSNN